MRNTRAPPPPVALLARLLPRLLIAAALVVSILYLSSASERWRQKTNSAAIGRRQLHLALAVGGRAAKPPHIPRTVHQMLIFGNWTAAGGGQNRAILPAQLGAQAQAAMQTWDDVNPGWEHRLWGGADIEALLRERYPQYLPTWAALSRPVERADMARYLVLHQYGGVYADSDVLCLRPMDAVIQPADGLVATWENLHPSPQSAVDNMFGRQAQMANWWLAAAPGHPALLYILEKIRSHARERLYENAQLDTMSRTGPGLYTEAVLQAAHAHPPSKGDGYSVRVLPKVCGGWGGTVVGLLHPAILTHLFLGSWKQREEPPLDSKPRFPRHHVQPLPHELLPTSVLFDPPFTLLHHQRGQGELQGGLDVGFQLAKYGVWQPNNLLEFPPGQLARFLDGLQPGEPEQPAVMVDVGAGYGYGMFSLAAAARGLAVVAFELENKSAAALQASIDWNGFPIQLSKVALGPGNSTRQRICAEPPPPDQGQQGQQQQGQQQQGQQRQQQNHIHHHHHHQQQQQHQQQAVAEAVPRGYGPAEAHSRVHGCQRLEWRVPALEAMEAALPQGGRVAAVRVSAGGWGVGVLEALLPLLRQHPVRSVQLEWSPGGGGPPAGEGGGGNSGSGLQALLQQLLALGFVEVQHSGPICRSRWKQHRLHIQDVPAGRGPDVAVDTALLERSPCRLVANDLQDVDAELGLLQGGAVEAFLLRRPPLPWAEGAAPQEETPAQPA